MKKLILLALVFMASASFNAVSAGKKKKKEKAAKADTVQVTLGSAADSLSYAAGVVRTEGLMPFLQQQFGVDASHIDEFAKGYDAMMKNGIDDKAKAYAAGQQIAIMVSQRMIPMLKDEFAGRNDSVKTDMFDKGFIAAVTGKNALMNDSVAKDYFNKAFKAAQAQKNEANRKAGEDFLAANKQKEGVVTLPSGLQYKILTKGTGEVPSVDDEVTVKYEGKLIDGKVFDSSYKRPGETSKFKPDQVIKGWTEALTMMPVGSKWELYIPQELAYGERQAGMIKPYSALIFTVEMVSIDKAKKAETDAKASGKPKVTAKPKVTPKKK